MKKHFIVSLVKNGLLGGCIIADLEAITYRSGKMSIPKEYRCLQIKYKDIGKVTEGRLSVLPTVRIELQSGEEYEFVVFFGKNIFVNTLKSMGVDA